jgi:hypothetical protein
MSYDLENEQRLKLPEQPEFVKFKPDSERHLKSKVALGIVTLICSVFFCIAFYFAWANMNNAATNLFTCKNGTQAEVDFYYWTSKALCDIFGVLSFVSLAFGTTLGIHFIASSRK